MADYCHALTGELEACKKYLIECEALQRDFLMRSQDREKAIEKDNAKLKEEIQKLLKHKQKLVEEKTRLVSERQSLSQTHSECEHPVAQAEQTLESCKAQLPKQLRETLLPPLAGEDLAARMRRFLDSLETIKDFNRQSSTVATEWMEGPDGIRREYQVLYFGLSLAYAVCADAKSTGMGLRHGTEWTWQWNSEWHPVITKVLGIRLGKRPPELLHLPLPPIPNGGEVK